MMKYSCQLLFCVSVLSFTRCVGTYNYGQPLLESAKTGSKGLLKRQLPEADIISQFIRCGELAIEEQCNSGLLQAAAEVAVNCNDLQMAQFFHNSCRRNSNGRYCDSGSSFLFVYTKDITNVCRNSTTVCSTECRNLLTRTRNELGCCINIGQNDSSNLIYDPEPFNYTLWSNCNVEPITEECTPSTVNLPQRSGRTCTPSSLFEQLNRVSCTRRYVEPVLKVLSATEGCDPIRQAALEQCGVNEFGTLCAQINSSTVQISSTSLVCENTQMCSQDCMEALQSLKGTYGCCVNNLYNGSLDNIVVPRMDWLSFEFWVQCGVSTPGICEAKLNGVPSFGTSSFNTVILILIILLLT